MVGQFGILHKWAQIHVLRPVSHFVPHKSFHMHLSTELHTKHFCIQNNLFIQVPICSTYTKYKKQFVFYNIIYLYITKLFSIYKIVCISISIYVLFKKNTFCGKKLRVTNIFLTFALITTSIFITTKLLCLCKSHHKVNYDYLNEKLL